MWISWIHCTMWSIITMSIVSWKPCMCFWALLISLRSDRPVYHYKLYWNCKRTSGIWVTVQVEIKKKKNTGPATGSIVPNPQKERSMLETCNLPRFIISIRGCETVDKQFMVWKASLKCHKHIGILELYRTSATFIYLYVFLPWVLEKPLDSEMCFIITWWVGCKNRILSHCFKSQVSLLDGIKPISCALIPLITEVQYLFSVLNWRYLDFSLSGGRDD